MPSAHRSSTLPSSLRSVISPILGRIQSSDRGAARERNARTTANRTSHFEQWCHAKGFHDTTFEFTAPEEAGSVLAAYAQEIAEGKGLAGRTTPTLRRFRVIFAQRLHQSSRKGTPTRVSFVTQPTGAVTDFTSLFLIAFLQPQRSGPRLAVPSASQSPSRCFITLWIE